MSSIVRYGLILFSLFFWQDALASPLVYNMTQGVTPLSKEIYNLHMIIFWVCVVIGIIVFSVMFYAMICHRKSKGAVAAHFHEHTLVEIIWTIIPCIILIVMAIPATKTLIRLEDYNDSDITIKVTGYMWRWHYDYIGDNVQFMSSLTTPYEQIINREPKDKNYLLEVDNPLVLPINKKIRILTTANDVVHSWFVPALGFKKDAIPGFINEIWATITVPGTYRGQCAELCGARHAFMPIVVKAVSLEEYTTWLNQQKQANIKK